MTSKSMVRVLRALVLANGALLLTTAPSCKAVIDGGGYEVVEKQCGATAPRPDDQLVKSCIFTASCSPFTPPWSISDCITWDLQTTFGGTVSAPYATSCGDVAARTGKGFVDSPGLCDGLADGWHCVGTKAVNCDSSMGVKKGTFRDCGVLGGACTEYTDGGGKKADCQLGACTDADTNYRCSGKVLYKCVNSQKYGQDCSRISSTCTSSTEGTTDCYYEPSTLCQGDVPSCVDNVAQSCSDKGGLLKYRCTSAGLECRNAGTYGECVPEGCAPGELTGCVESCDNNDVLTVCVGGQPYKVACGPLGFTKCELRKLKNNQTLALCVY